LDAEDTELGNELKCLVTSLDLTQMNLTEAKVHELISSQGVKIVNRRGRHDRTLLHEAFLQRKYETARSFVDLAAKSDTEIEMRWGDGDLLKWALDKGSWHCVDYVLKKMTGKCGSVKETAKVLKDHFKELIAKHPLLVEDYLIKDKFCFEYGRFKVPAHLFETRDCLFLTTDKAVNWQARGGEAEDFWRKNCPIVATCVKHDADLQITAIAKFACIEDVAHNGPGKSIPSRLLCSDATVNVFMSPLISLLVQWKWHRFWKSRYRVAFVLQILNAAAFILYAANFGFEADGDRHVRQVSIFSDTADAYRLAGDWNVTADDDLSIGIWHVNATSPLSVTADTWDFHTGAPIQVARWSLSLSILVGLLSVVLRVVPPLKFVSVFVKSVLWGYSICHVEHTNFTVFLTSFECVATVISVLWFFQAFRCTGPLTSMVWYSILDTRVFLVFGAVVMAGFAEAMHVLYGNRFRGDDGGHYNSPHRSFESMAHAVLGQFEPNVIRADMDNAFLHSCRVILFDVFLFIGPILMLALLVSILGDTYDRVKAAEKAEQNKARARVIYVSEKMIGWLQKMLPAREPAKEEQRFQSIDRTFSRQIQDAMTWISGRRQREKKYFHFLVPAEPPDKFKDMSWQGSLQSIKRSFKRTVEESEKKTSNELRDLKNRLDMLEQQCCGLKALEQNSLELREFMRNLIIQNEEILAEIKPKSDQPGTSADVPDSN